MIKSPYNFSKLTKIVEDEYEKWERGKLNEKSKKAVPILRKYWNNVNIKPTDSEIQDKAWQNKWPWSAAFISWVITRVDANFPKTTAHRVYTKAAMDNRNGKKNGWHLFSLKKEKVYAQVGDILVKPRSGSYTNSHGDIVWKVEGNNAYLAGGNLGNTMKTTSSVKLNSDGTYVKTPSRYLVVLKKM